MHICSPDSQFSEIDLDDYEVAPLPKEPDNRGYIYLLEDLAFPGFIKIGRTICMKKRLMQYNADRPYNTVQLIALTEEFHDANNVEKKMLICSTRLCVLLANLLTKLRI